MWFYAEASISERVHMLSQKITSAPLVKPSDTAKRYQFLENACEDIQKQLEEFRIFNQDKMVDLRHITTKINKELKKDHESVDSLIKQQIAISSERMMVLIEEQQEARRETDSKIMKYIEDESNFIRETIQIQKNKREQEGNVIQDSLGADIGEIRRTLEEISTQCAERMNRNQGEFLERTNNLSSKLTEICTTYSNNESQFYKMLRDIVKKVKTELSEHQTKRQQTQTQILNLIQKMCDRAISQKTN